VVVDGGMIVVVLTVCAGMLKLGEVKSEIRAANPKGVYGVGMHKITQQKQAHHVQMYDQNRLTRGNTNHNTHIARYSKS
jgi:hypothetical protein